MPAKHTPDEWIRQQLHAGQRLTIQHIQQATSLSDRQIRRHISALRQEGLPIQQERSGLRKRFFLPADRQQVTVPDLQFDAAELRALAIAAKASRSLLIDTPHAQALHQAFEKLLERARPVSYVFDLDEPMQEWHFDETPSNLIAPDCFRQLEQAMDERRSVRIDYLTAKDGRSSVDRKVDPYCFVKRHRAWLLIAFCHQRNDLRNFALTRISRVVPCDDALETAFFSVPEDFHAEDYFRASLGAINSGECYELRLLVEPEKALFFRERFYHPTQLIEEDRPDGRLVVSYELEGLEEMRSFCQSWGTGMTVIGPDELRERLLQDARLLIERYQ